MTKLLKQFNGGTSTATPPAQAPAPAPSPSTDFFSAETKARAQQAAEVAMEKTQATVSQVTKRVNRLAGQVKERAATVTVPKVSAPKISGKALGLGGAVLCLVIGAGWWFTRAPAPQATPVATVAKPAPVTVAPSTPAPVAAPVAAPATAAAPARAATVAIARVEPTTPAPAPALTRVVLQAPVTPPAPAVVAPASVTQAPLANGPVKSPTPEEINARWNQAVKLPKPVKRAPAAEVKPQYEQDADAALNAWKKSH